MFDALEDVLGGLSFGLRRNVQTNADEEREGMGFHQHLAGYVENGLQSVDHRSPNHFVASLSSLSSLLSSRPSFVTASDHKQETTPIQNVWKHSSNVHMPMDSSLFASLRPKHHPSQTWTLRLMLCSPVCAVILVAQAQGSHGGGTARGMRPGHGGQGMDTAVLTAHSVSRLNDKDSHTRSETLSPRVNK